MRLLICFFICTLPLSQQIGYQLTFHRGAVTNAGNGPELRDGEKLNASDQLKIPSGGFVSIFSSSTGRVSYLNRSGKTVTLTVAAISAQSAKPGISAAKQDILPPLSGHIMAVRAPVISSVIAFQHYLSALSLTEQMPMVILDPVKLPLDRNYFTDNDRNFFYISYTTGADTINKRLGYSGEYLVLDSNLFQVDGHMQIIATPVKAELYYAKTTTKGLADIGSFWVRKVSRAEAIRLIETVLVEVKPAESDSSRLRQLLYEEFTADYGSVDRYDFNRFLDKNFKNAL